GCQAVVVPYSGYEMSMVIVLPDTSSGADAALAARLPEIAAATSSRKVELSLPRWDFGSRAQLADVLAALGMPSAFDPSRADLSAMSQSDEAPLYISKVIHEANITVDEDGTEAAAATAVLVVPTSAPLPTEPIPFVCDRPFLFAVRDDATGALLFTGRVADPTQTRD
ncbi:MAG TPA: serpin family protein, partial [Ilumatobacteraceae bacterium]|nr:serpin family protein [Ilumatobacteraceae bacterium]